LKELNLPVVINALPAAKWLDMDDYFQFVTFQLAYTIDKKSVRKQKRLAAVNVPFSLGKK